MTQELTVRIPINENPAPRLAQAAREGWVFKSMETTATHFVYKFTKP